MSATADGIKTLRLVATAALQRWYLVIGSIVVCLALVVVFCNLRSVQYTTSMVVTPADSGSNSMSSAMNALSGGGASLLGLVGGSQTPQFDRYIILLQSDSVSRDIMKDPHMMELLFGKAIDPATGEWRLTTGRKIKNAVLRLFGVTSPTRPTADDVKLILNTKLVVDQDLLSKTKATVTCTATDTFTCRDIMIAISKAAQARLDKITFENARHMISYLNDLLTQANEVSLRQALTGVIATTQVQAALTSIGRQNVIVLDGPGTPSIPAFPKVPMMIEMSILVGFMIGVALAWLLRDKALFSPRNAYYHSSQEV